jgi:hypothetical protein
MSQFLTPHETLERISRLLVNSPDWSATDLITIAQILQDQGELASCACGRVRMPDEPACPHHNIYPTEDDDV